MVKQGLTKSIGVSNATAPILMDIIAGAEIKPAINQIEVHPYCAQPALLKMHEKLGVKVESYAAIGAGSFQGRGEELKDVMVI